MKTQCKLICPLCKREMDRETIAVSSFAHNSIIKKIKKEHPDWMQQTGLCPVCLDYYEKLYLTARAG